MNTVAITGTFSRADFGDAQLALRLCAAVEGAEKYKERREGCEFH